MIGTFENPTLDLDPSKPDTLNVITATRSGVATYTDAAGVIQSASADTVRVDYVQGEELTPTKYQHTGYTDFSSGWATFHSGATSVMGGGYQSSESRVVSVTLNGGYGFYAPVVEGASYTLSFMVRRISGSSPVYLNGYLAVSDNVLINLSSEWQRVEATFIANSNPMVRFGIFLTGSGDSVEIAMPQVEEGTTASSFVANTTGSPKFITGATYGPRVPMILVEPSATNLFRNSQDLTASPNFKFNATITQESETFKGQPVFRLTDDTISGEHGLNIRAGSVTASRVIVHFFVKPDTCSKVCITYPTAGDASAAWNLQSGSALGSIVGSAVSQTIEDAGDGWFKVSMTYDRPSAAAIGHNIHTLQDSATSAVTRNYQGDGTLSFLMTMPQLEYGEVQTSYIPTSGSTVTRAADDLVISGSDFDFFNNSEGTFYVEYQFNDADGANSLIYGSADNQRFAYKNLGSFSPLLSYDGVNVLNYGRLSAGTLLRTALSFDSNSMEGSQDGSAATMSGQTAPFPHNGNLLSATELNIGSNTTGALHLNGHIKRLIYWPYHSDSL